VLARNSFVKIRVRGFFDQSNDFHGFSKHSCAVRYTMGDLGSSAAAKPDLLDLHVIIEPLESCKCTLYMDSRNMNDNKNQAKATIKDMSERRQTSG